MQALANEPAVSCYRSTDVRSRCSTMDVILACEGRGRSVGAEVDVDSGSGIEKMLRHALPECDLLRDTDDPSPFEMEKALDK